MSRWLPVALILLCGPLFAQPEAIDEDAAPAKPLAGKAVWPTVGGDLRRTSVATAPKIDRVPAVRWALSLTPYRSSFCAPTAGYGRVFLPIGNNHSQSNCLIGLDAKTGRQYWSQASMGWLATTCPGLGEGKVLLGCGDNAFRCHDAADGRLLWTVSTSHHFYSYPLIEKSVAYIACRDNTFHAIDLKTGKAKWQYDGESYSKGSPAMADGRIVFGEREKYVTCIAAKDGKKLWRFEGDDWLDMPITIADGIAFAGGRGGVLFAIDLVKGLKRWTYKTDGALRGPAAVVGDLLLLGSADGFLHALDVKTGKPRWKFKAAGPIQGGAIVVGDLAYVADGAGRLTAVRVTDGTATWQRKLGTAFISPMAADGEALYMVDEGEGADGVVGSGGLSMRTGARLLCVVDGWADADLLKAVLGVKQQVDQSARVAKLIALLGADEYRVRESAEARLGQIGPAAAGPLAKAAQSTDWEVRERAERLLKKLGAPAKTDAGVAARELGLDHDVAYLLHWLGAADAGTRAAVHRRLAVVVDGLPAFDPAADAKARAAQLAALRQWWTARKANLRWDGASGKYVPTSQ